MSVGQWRGVGRGLIGFLFVAIGVLRQFDPTIYPVNGQRDPTTLAAINGLVFVGGIVLILSAVIPFVRGSRSN